MNVEKGTVEGDFKGVFVARLVAWIQRETDYRRAAAQLKPGGLMLVVVLHACAGMLACCDLAWKPTFWKRTFWNLLMAIRGAGTRPVLAEGVQLSPPL